LSRNRSRPPTPPLPLRAPGSALVCAGTERGTGWHETKAKRELYFDDKRGGELAADFRREATELRKVGAVRDAIAMKTWFGKSGKACKACHGELKIKDWTNCGRKKRGVCRQW